MQPKKWVKEREQFSTDVQKVFLSLMVADPDLFAKCRPTIRDEFFDDELRPAVRFITEHTDNYRVLPTLDMIEAKAGLRVSAVGPDQVASQRQWFCDDFEAFMRYRAMENAILDGVDLLREGRAEEVQQRVKDALTIRLVSDLGTNYFADPEARLRRLLDNSAMVSTGWPAMDDKLFGGFARGGLNIFLGNPGCVVAGTKVRAVKPPRLPNPG